MRPPSGWSRCWGIIESEAIGYRLGVLVYPTLYSLAQANQAFADDGSLVDPKLAERLAKTVEAYIRLGTALETTNP